VIRRDILENQANICFLAIGSNLGDKVNNINSSKKLLEKIPVKILASSSIYLTPAWPNPKDPSFNNVVVKVKTKLNLKTLFKEIKKIEMTLGRIGKLRNSPRTCDIDIIDFNGKYFDFINIDLKVPHPRMDKRNFVLLPLFEINKNWKHPKTKKNIVNLISNLKGDDIRSIKMI
jgi:2-amino-4-hydroxy-6-hydroxymethyldihydropteridine diphosphokinase